VSGVGKFADVLPAPDTAAIVATRSIRPRSRTRQIERKLKDVEALRNPRSSRRERSPACRRIGLKRIAVLTSGGDAPGHERRGARPVTRRRARPGAEVFGVRNPICRLLTIMLRFIGPAIGHPVLALHELGQAGPAGHLRYRPSVGTNRIAKSVVAGGSRYFSRMVFASSLTRVSSALRRLRRLRGRHAPARRSISRSLRAGISSRSAARPAPAPPGRAAGSRIRPAGRIPGASPRSLRTARGPAAAPEARRAGLRPRFPGS